MTKCEIARGFDEFWLGSDQFKRYPRRARKQETEKQYNIALKEVTHRQIMVAVQIALKKEWNQLIEEGKIYYIPQSDNWFKDKRYYDYEGEREIELDAPLDRKPYEKWTKDERQWVYERAKRFERFSGALHENLGLKREDVERVMDEFSGNVVKLERG